MAGGIFCKMVVVVVQEVVQVVEWLMLNNSACSIGTLRDATLFTGLRCKSCQISDELALSSYDKSIDSIQR
jgi:hypothetical protein